MATDEQKQLAKALDILKKNKDAAFLLQMIELNKNIERLATALEKRRGIINR